MMTFYGDGNKIKDAYHAIPAAIANNENAAKIIAKALNHYFNGSVTNNKAIELMHENTANALNKIADFVQKNEYSSDEIISFLRDTALDMESQALIVSLRDELKINTKK